MYSITYEPPGSLRPYFVARVAEDNGAITLKINGVPYTLTKVANEVCPCFAVTKNRDGSTYHVSRHPWGAECTCPDFVFKREHKDRRGCKHCRALTELHFIDTPHQLNLPRLDPWRPCFTDQEFQQQIELRAQSPDREMQLTLAEWIDAQAVKHFGMLDDTHDLVAGILSDLRDEVSAAKAQTADSFLMQLGIDVNELQWHPRIQLLESREPESACHQPLAWRLERMALGYLKLGHSAGKLIAWTLRKAAEKAERQGCQSVHQYREDAPEATPEPLSV